jgi:predicted PurR-regulated permease PerM
MPKVSGSSSLPPLSGNRALVLLAYTVLAATVLAGLYWLQPVLIPLALGILFATIAAPVMRALERCGLSRVPALVTLVTLVLVIGVGLVWLIYAQTTQLLIDLPKYEKNIIAKIDATKSMTHSSWRENWEQLVGQVTQAVQESPVDSSEAAPQTNFRVVF